MALQAKKRQLTIDTDRASAYRAEPDYLDSQQTTPRAGEPPNPMFDRPKQEPQFYTWEDFAQDERMHHAETEEHEEHSDVGQMARETERGHEAVEAGNHREIRSEDDQAMQSHSPDRSDSPTVSDNDDDLGKGVAAAASSGSAASLASKGFESGAHQDSPSAEYIEPADAPPSELADASEPSTRDVASSDLDLATALKEEMRDGSAETETESVMIVSNREPDEMDQFLQAEESMEEGKSEAAQPRNEMVEIVSTHEPNEMDRFLQPEEDMEEGRLDAEQPRHDPGNFGEDLAVG